MRWFLVDKSKAAPPTGGTYRTWKPHLRIEGRRQCVYCAIGEPLFGGERNFHVEHYRPKKIFAELRDAYSNLFYVCAICNSFKGSDWPGEPRDDHGAAAYPDPSVVDYSELLEIGGDGSVCSGFVAGAYLIERLNLNRAQLRMIRKFISLRDEVDFLIQRIEFEAESCDDMALLRECNKCIAEAYRMMVDFTKAIPYEQDDARR